MLCFTVMAVGIDRPRADPDEYLIEAGDVLEVTSATAPELRGRLVVQLDGSVSLPLAGRLQAAGLTLVQAQDAIRSALGSKAFRQRGPEGRESVFLVPPQDVGIAIVEFRPVYVTGDVAKPGEQAYRPNMTARQAIAVSGGLDVGRYRAAHPVVEAADLKGEHEALWIDLARRWVVIWRLKRELGGKEPLDEAELRRMPVEPGLLMRFVQIEKGQLEARDRDYGFERRYLEAVIKQAEQQMAILTDQRDKEEQGREADLDELRRAQEMFGKGALTSVRVTEARRAVLLSSTRKLQADSQLATLQKQRTDAASSLERIDGQRKIRLNQELIEANAALATTRARLEAVSEKASYVALLRSSLQRALGGETEIHVVRKTVRTRVPDDAPLLPGDVVEVALTTPAPPALSYRPRTTSLQ